MIALEPVGGLGNRMRAVDGALSLARECGVPLRVIWTRTADCGCRFSDLFAPWPDARVIERGWWMNRAMRRIELYGGRHSRELRLDETRRLLCDGYDFRELTSQPSVFIQTFDRFYPTRGRPFGDFVPLPPLQSAISRVTSAFGAQVIGVHVRRGDHESSRRRSPVSGFVERMQAAVDANSSTQFFLATDSEQVEADLRQTFGDRLLRRPKTFNRTSVAGIRDAVVELYCLAQTQRIIGSFYSSFCETAAEIGGIALDVVDTENRPERTTPLRAGTIRGE